MPLRLLGLLIAIAGSSLAQTHVPKSPANRLLHLNDPSPFYPHKDFPKLITPQWVGEKGAEAVVTLGIDDMRDAPKYEQFLRPILERLKKIDGRAPVSILTNRIQPEDPQVQAWLKEGLSIEVHTLTHPCPLLQKGNFRQSFNVVHGGVDLLSQIKGNNPVAYRMPCCDSMNSLSPRFFAEIFNKTSTDGRYLQIDSSVFNIMTSKDKSLPRQWVLDKDGEERFTKYLPKKATRPGMRTMGSYVGTIEDYPYPFVINRLCWEFACVVPSDWEAHNYIGNQQPQMLEDWKRALDVTVKKQGVMNLVFHPHGWSSTVQLVEFVDYAQKTYGPKVKFLNFRECAERLNKTLLKGSSLRNAKGQDNGVRVLDANNDGYMDVLIGEKKVTRIWNPKQSTWTEHNLPFDPKQTLAGVLDQSGTASMIDAKGSGLLWSFQKDGWNRVQTNSIKQSEQLPSSLKEIRELIASSKPAFDRITKNEGETSDWYDYSATMTTRFTLRQRAKEKVLEWESPVMSANPNKPVVLCLTGGLGYESQPATDGFTLAVDGKDTLPFDLSRKFIRWQSKDNSMELIHLPTWTTDLDSGGYFFFVLPKGYIKKDRAIQFSVKSMGEGSQRWFSIDAKQDFEGSLRRLSAKMGKSNSAIGSLRDVDNDGVCELISSRVYGWDSKKNLWTARPYNLPAGINHTNEGIRFIDLNKDGFDDIVFSDENNWGIYLWETRINPGLGWHPGWSHTVREGNRDDKDAIPMISRGGFNPNNGTWFHSNHLWVQNENTAHMPDVVDRRSFKELLNSGEPQAKEPEASRQCFQVSEEFEVRLVASEPQIQDPVAFDWSADGRLWVAEMGDYPSGIDGKPGGIVRWLEDTDGNGRYEKSTVFLDGLNFPNGLMPWGKGVLISAAPDILYAEDSSGDGRADIRRVLFTGFREGNQQHRMNGFCYGLDNWIYGANGDSGGVVKSLATDKSVNISGLDFRFKVTGEFEVVAGQTQFGRWRDDWGNWFGNNNPNWVWHYHVPLHYFARNPQLAVGATRRNTFSSNRLFPISKELLRPNTPHAYGRVTSANSATPYRGGLLTKKDASIARSIFISEPVHNLVHREVLEPNGVSFRSHRAKGEEKREFLASTDNWFRPTQIKTGPDGALYVADMYRLVIEHPEWIPATMQSRLDLRAGHDRGRIWKVCAKNAKLRSTPNLSKMNSTQLASLIDHANGWQRDTAQRLLLEKEDKAAVKPLMEVFKNSKLPQARLQALCTLDGLNATGSEAIDLGLRDKHPSVRQHAAILCRGKNSLLSIKAINDPSPLVRRQVAFSIGNTTDTKAAKALVQLAHDKNADVRLAVKSSATPHLAAMLSEIFASDKQPPQDITGHLLQLATSGNNQNALVQVLTEMSSPKYRLIKVRMMSGFLDTLNTQGQTLTIFLKQANAPLKQAVIGTDILFTYARAHLDDPIAIPLLTRGLNHHEADRLKLIGLLNAKEPPAIQKIALATLSKGEHPKLTTQLLKDWSSYGPSTRAGVIDTLLTREAWTQSLLTKLEKGILSVTQISPAHRQKLNQHPNASIKSKASKLFGQIDSNRAKVIARYQNVVKLQGDMKRGAELFKANCAVCHKFKNEGNPVGPDLATLADKPTADWLIGILDPNRAVEDKYIGYVIITRSQAVHIGVITVETPTSLTLRTLTGQEEVILRTNIKSLQSTGVSLMPEGLEATLAPLALADLLSHLKAR